MDDIIIGSYRSRITELETQLRQEREANYEHPDSRAVNAFAAKMKDKLSAKRAEGKAGWEDRATCSVNELAQWMVEHLAKGDPVDIANFCMMISMRGETGNGGAISRAWQAQVAQLQATQNAENPEDCAACSHPGKDHDDEFGNCASCGCMEYIDSTQMITQLKERINEVAVLSRQLGHEDRDFEVAQLQATISTLESELEPYRKWVAGQRSKEKTDAGR